MAVKYDLQMPRDCNLSGIESHGALFIYLLSFKCHVYNMVTFLIEVVVNQTTRSISSKSYQIKHLSFGQISIPSLPNIYIFGLWEKDVSCSGSTMGYWE